MLRFRFGAPVESTTDEAEESNHDNEVRVIKEKLLLNLRNYESVIFYIQQLLVWEKPFHSAVFVAILHAIFWYLKVWSSHAMGLIATVLLILIWLDMWKHRIWPEIRAEAPDPEASEWGELHPRLLSLPELCTICAETIVTIQFYVAKFWQVRSDAPKKFALFVSLGCVCAIVMGGAIPGTLIAYIIMVCCLMWPLLWYRRWIERAYAQIEPFLMQLQYSLKPRMKHNGKKSSHITRTEIDGTCVEVHTDSSSDDDDDISEFIKPLDPLTTEVLARALTDDDELSESEESLLAHEIPSFSHPSSLHGDSESPTLPEIPIPSDVPPYEHPAFKRDVLAEHSDDELGLPQNSNSVQLDIARDLMTNATAEVLTSAVKKAFGDAAATIQESMIPSCGPPSELSTPSDDGFVVLKESDLE